MTWVLIKRHALGSEASVMVYCMKQGGKDGGFWRRWINNLYAGTVNEN